MTFRVHSLPQAYAPVVLVAQETRPLIGLPSPCVQSRKVHFQCPDGNGVGSTRCRPGSPFPLPEVLTARPFPQLGPVCPQFLVEFRLCLGKVVFDLSNLPACA